MPRDRNGQGSRVRALERFRNRSQSGSERQGRRGSGLSVGDESGFDGGAGEQGGKARRRIRRGGCKMIWRGAGAETLFTDRSGSLTTQPGSRRGPQPGRKRDLGGAGQSNIFIII